MSHSLNVGVSGVHKAILDPDGIWYGRKGVWKKILTGHIGSGGQWKLFYGNVPSNVVHLYKDAADVPSGATRLSAYDGDFPMITATAGEIGTTGGAVTHTGAAHGALSGYSGYVSHSISWYHCTFLCYGYDIHDSQHRHTVNHTMGEVANNNLPEYVDVLAYTHTYFGAEALFLYAGAGTPGGWNDYEPMDAKYPRFNSTAGGSGGSATHTHSYTGASGAYSGATTNSSNKRTDYIYSHTHDLDHSHSKTLYPLYHELKLIYRSTPVLTIYDLPKGTVLLLTSSVVPVGFSVYGSGAGELVRGTKGAPGTSSGTETHGHDSESMYTGTYNLGTSYEGNTAGSDTYTPNYSVHTFDHGHTTVTTHMPPWVKLYAVIKD